MAADAGEADTPALLMGSHGEDLPRGGSEQSLPGPQPARTLMASSSLPSPGKGARCRNMVFTLGLSMADETTQEGFASFELMAECAPQFEIAIEILALSAHDN